jgi:hypothetical protein
MSDEPQGGMGWLLPWAENNSLNQASVASIAAVKTIRPRVCSQSVGQQVAAVMTGKAHRPVIEMRSDWYY